MENPTDSASFGDLISPIIITEGESEKKPNKKTPPPNQATKSSKFLIKKKKKKGMGFVYFCVRDLRWWGLTIKKKIKSFVSLHKIVQY